MSSYLDYALINIMVSNSKGAIAYLEQTSDNVNLCNPFPSIGTGKAVYYKGDIQKWISQLIKFVHLESTSEFQTILDDIHSVDAVYQEVSCDSEGCFCRYHWNKDTGMCRSYISIDMNYGEELLMRRNDIAFEMIVGEDVNVISTVMDNGEELRYIKTAIDDHLWDFSKKIIAESASETTTKYGTGYFKKIETEFSQEELQQLTEEKWHSLFSPFFEELFTSDYHGKTFVICEADYRYTTNSEGKQLAKRLIEKGAKEGSRISTKTNYVFVSTKKISALYDLCNMSTLSAGELELWVAKNGKPLLWTAVEMKKSGHPIQIITIENALQCLDNEKNPNESSKKQHQAGTQNNSRPLNDDWEEIIQILKSYYANRSAAPHTIKELEKNHPEFPWKKLSAYTMKTYRESAQTFLFRCGLLQPEQSAEQKLETTIALLKKRYANQSSKAFTMLDLEIQNPDISINQLTYWIKKTTNFSPADYLMRKGILIESEWMKRYRENNQMDVNHEYLKNAFADVNLDALKGQKCIILEDCDWARKKLLAILDLFEVIIETEFTDNTNYIITSVHNIQIDPPLGNPVIDAAVKKIDLSKDAMFVSVYDILRQADNLRAATFLAKSFEDKVDYAIKLFDVCIARITEEFGKLRGFDDPVTTNNSRVSGKQTKISDENDIVPFIELLEKHIVEKYPVMLNELCFPANYLQWMNMHIRSLRPSTPFPGIGLYQALGLVIAYMVFVSPGATIELEFTGDRRDLHVDYCKGEKIYLLLSNSDCDIEVGTRVYY